VVCYVDKKTHHIYTATLGDSEANIYRKFDDKLKSIPLSCIRDWSSKKDAHRASIALGRPQIAINWPKISNPKYLRFPYPFFGINVSRSIGDVLLSGSPEKPGVIHKPKITRIQVKSGDLLILACDGLKDYVSDNEIVSILKNPPPNPAKHLVNYAIDEGNSLDNVTVLAIAIN
jgi:serine/threonine protein phosphatase PrpC